MNMKTAGAPCDGILVWLIHFDHRGAVRVTKEIADDEVLTQVGYNTEDLYLVQRSY